MAFAYLFLHAQWQKQENLSHADSPAALRMLGPYDVKMESSSLDSRKVIRMDIGVVIPRESSIPVQKTMSGNSPLTCLLSINAKATGVVEEHIYVPLVSLTYHRSIKSVDHAMDICLAESTRTSSNGSMNAALNNFLANEFDCKWPQAILRK